MKPQKSTLVLAALSGVPFIMVLGNSMLIPVLPAIKAALNLTQFKVSLLITLFSIPAGIVIPLAGFLSDRFSRKKVIVPALILYGLGGIVAGLAAIFLKSLAYPAILGGRILQGIGAAGTAPIAMALTGDLFTGKQRGTALGIIEAANGLGKVVSPVLGALLGLITWYATFLFFPLVIIPVVLGVWFLVKEPESNRQAQSVNEYLKSIARIFEKKSAMLLTSFLGGAVALLILFGVLFFLSEHLETVFRLNGVRKGGALAIPVLFMSTTSYLTGRIIKKRLALMKWLVVVGLALIGGALTMMGFYRTTYLFFIAISLAGIGTGLTLPCLNTIITSSTATERRGLVTSLYGGVRFVGVAFGPPLFGLLMGYGLSLMFWSTGALAGVAALLAAFLIRVKDMKAPTAPEEKNRLTPYTLQPAFGLAARKPWNPPDEQGT
ncbi:MFS transporter [Desulfofundulus thermosubterraneus]|uniref:MFS transporter, ACDE family, multidrug resistance protein n=1 Tax=Desulfofundulus thermosubterraneus DSM 16057 TaxID=1121432 RepID=A0A1M6BTC6_9FIRM|nr:MFS transporter [Desulfofundulus thermosubterraneus]SHI51980.1 MFS transporter, ACDE family, multidrug resistance protein [Desulfofundulus thermosubterraneus DSM 16057]